MLGVKHLERSCCVSWPAGFHFKRSSIFRLDFYQVPPGLISTCRALSDTHYNRLYIAIYKVLLSFYEDLHSSLMFYSLRSGSYNIIWRWKEQFPSKSTVGFGSNPLNLKESPVETSRKGRPLCCSSWLDLDLLDWYHECVFDTKTRTQFFSSTLPKAFIKFMKRSSMGVHVPRITIDGYKQKWKISSGFLFDTSLFTSTSLPTACEDRSFVIQRC